MSDFFIDPKDKEFKLGENHFIKESDLKLKISSNTSKEFFKKTKSIFYYISILLNICVLITVIFFNRYFLGENGLIWVFVFLFIEFFSLIPVIIESQSSDYAKKLLIFLSSEGIEIIQLENRDNKLNINSSNIEDIYIKNSQMQMQMRNEITGKIDQKYLPAYNIILRLKTPIYLKLFKECKQEFVLCDGIYKTEANKDATEYSINLIKRYLNLVSYKREENIVKYIRIEDKIVLEKTRDYLNIITDAKEDFFDIKILPLIRVVASWICFIFFMLFIIPVSVFVIFLLIKILVPCISDLISNFDVLSGLFVHISLYSLIATFVLLFLYQSIYFIVYKLIDKKMVLSISNAGIDIITKEKTISIDKYDIKNLYKTGIKKGDFLANFKIEPYSYVPLDRYSNYTAIMLQLREPISLEPINKKKKQDFNLLGNLPREHYDKMELIYEEIRKMLGFVEKDPNSYLEKEE